MMEQNKTPVGRKNYNSIDLAKFICSILIVMLHVPPFGLDAAGFSVAHILNFGTRHYLARLAVPFFFICSGFLLFRKSSPTEFSMKPTVGYIKKLLKFYLIWTLIYLPLSIVNMIDSGRGFWENILNYLKRCIFAGSYTQLWYLPATVVAVLIVSALLHFKLSPKKITVIAFVFYVIGLLGQSWAWVLKPLRDALPPVATAIDWFNSIIGSTRNGVFFGFIFVALGMLFAYSGPVVSKKASLIGFAVSMVLFLAELGALTYFDLAGACDIYLFLLPAVYFAFSFVIGLELPDRPVYKTLRHLSSLIYYLHLFVSFAVERLLALISGSLSRSALLFVLTLAVTVLLSLGIIKLSENEKFAWLKKLYL